MKKKAKLHLDFDLDGAKLNFAISTDEQPRSGEESDWSLQRCELNSEEFGNFPGPAKVDDASVKKIADMIDKAVEGIAEECNCYFDLPIELSVASNCFYIQKVPIYPPFPFNEDRLVTEEMVAEMRKKTREHVEQMYIPSPAKKIRILINDNFFIKEGGIEYRTKNPVGQQVRQIGLDSYIIYIHPIIAKLEELLKSDKYKYKNINISLTAENEFFALACEEEKIGETALVNITDFCSEISLWEDGELKTMKTVQNSLKKFKDVIWKLCLFYYNYPEFANEDFEYLKNAETAKDFYDKIENSKVVSDASGIDLENLYNSISCVLDDENSEDAKFRRLFVPQKKIKKTKMTISNYVLSLFARETLRGIFSDIKKELEEDEFCKAKRILLECSLPLNGIENFAQEFFEMPVRRGAINWKNEETAISAAGIGALRSLISNKRKSGTQKAVKVAEKDDATIFGKLKEFFS